MADGLNLNAYLERIGFAGSIAPSLDTLAILHALHPAAIAFENLDPLMGVPVQLDLQSLQHKLVEDRRGGFCLEHNMLMRAVLEDLGYAVRSHAARVLLGRPEGAAGPVSHMVLSVDVAGGTYLVDVGFGGGTPTAPLRLRPGLEQQTPHETYRITGGDPEFQLEMLFGEQWRPLYAFEMADRSDVEFEAIADMVTAPDGSMTQTIMLARPEQGRRLALAGARLSIYPVGGAPEIRDITSLSEMRDVLAQGFGIAPPPSALLDPVIEKALGTSPPEVSS